MKELRILSPTAILGYGFPMESFVEGMKRKPHVIAVDAGSTDPGPYYLGAGKSFTDRNSVKRDLEIMIPGTFIYTSFGALAYSSIPIESTSLIQDDLQYKASATIISAK